jgi:cysteine desulfurase
MKKLERRIRDDTILISIQYANNEIGTMQPVADIGTLAEERGIAFHSDAVAAEGLVPFDVKRDRIHLMSLSSNDFYGPRGVGVLYMKKRYRVNPILIGGGQERGLRSGTEDIASIIALLQGPGHISLYWVSLHLKDFGAISYIDCHRVDT